MIEVVAAIIERDGKILIAKRPDNKHQGGKWEFPGGKVEAGESPEAALVREIKEEIDLEISDLRHFESVEFHYPEKSVRLHFYRASCATVEARGMDGQEVAWILLDELGKFSFPDANLAIVRKLSGAEKF